MSERIHQQYNKEPLSEVDRQTRDLTVLLLDKRFSRAEAEEAYLRVAGIDVEGEETDRVKELKERLETLLDTGYPMNRIAKFVEAAGRLEFGKEEYESFVDSLSISQTEKRLLKSIPQKRRRGRLAVFSTENELLAEAKIGDFQRIDEQLLYAGTLESLQDLLRLTSAEKIQFEFEED